MNRVPSLSPLLTAIALLALAIGCAASESKESEIYNSLGSTNINLAEIEKKEGVYKTASGLLYEITKKSDNNDTPLATSNVTVHYEGKLLDGTVFDSSYQRGQPATFPLNGVIAGWTEGVQLMNVGDEFIFYIPSELAYGERGAPGVIPPHSDLVFKVELIYIQ